MKYLLDTHTWIWWNMNPKRLSAKVKRLISEPTRYEELLLSAISPWEFCKLLDKKKTHHRLRSGRVDEPRFGS